MFIGVIFCLTWPNNISNEQYTHMYTISCGYRYRPEEDITLVTYENTVLPSILVSPLSCRPSPSGAPHPGASLPKYQSPPAIDRPHRKPSSPPQRSFPSDPRPGLSLPPATRAHAPNAPRCRTLSGPLCGTLHLAPHPLVAFRPVAKESAPTCPLCHKPCACTHEFSHHREDVLSRLLIYRGLLQYCRGVPEGGGGQGGG